MGAPTVVDLFCGAGGFSEGFRRAGFRVVLGVDREPRMLATYRANHPDTEVWERDVLTIDPSELPDTDVIIGSPPCQPFSIANRKRDPELGMVLVNWMLDTVRAKRPRFWVMENVPLATKHLPSWVPVVRVLNAAEYGVPQTRRRCFAGDYPVPAPTHTLGPVPQRSLDRGVLRPWVTVREAIGDLPPPALHSVTIVSDRALRRISTARGGLRVQDPDRPSRTVVTYWRGPNIFDTFLATEPVPQHSLPASELEAMEGRNLGGEFTRKNPPLDLGLPSRTVKSHLAKAPKELLLPLATNPGEAVLYRRLTVREAARLQSFPDSYVFVGPRSWQYRQVGEAVPPLLAFHIANAMRPAFGMEPLPPPRSFHEWVRS